VCTRTSKAWPNRAATFWAVAQFKLGVFDKVTH
jgi:hypothetical protein